MPATKQHTAASKKGAASSSAAAPAKKTSAAQGKKVKAVSKPLKVKASSPAPVGLVAVFCDRLTQIIDRRQDVIRSGRGRTNDFAQKFGMHYTTASRLLDGKSLPPADVLFAIADAFDVTESWLLGRGPVDVDDLLDNSDTKIHIFNPRSEAKDQYATIPTSELPVGFDSSKLVFNKTTTELGEDVSVIVKLTAEAHEGRVHLLFDPANSKTYLRRINIVPSRAELFCFGTDTGASETLSISEVEFGNLQMCEAPKGKSKNTAEVVVIGPVVARIAFGFKGD